MDQVVVVRGVSILLIMEKFPFIKRCFFSGALYQIRRTTDDSSKSTATPILTRKTSYKHFKRFSPVKQRINIHSGLLKQYPIEL